MAKRRMFTLDVLDRDAFLDLSHGAHALYFYLCMHADDEGFVGKAKLLTRGFHCTAKHLQELFDSGMLLHFDSGVVVITDWLRHNTIKRDRSVRTVYIKERELIYADEERIYRMRTGQEEDHSILCKAQETPETLPESEQDGSEIVPEMEPVGSGSVPETEQVASTLVPQNRIEENRKEKIIKDNNKIDQNIKQIMATEHKHPGLAQIVRHCKEKGYTDVNPVEFLNYYLGKPVMMGKHPLDEWESLLEKWNREKWTVPSQKPNFYGSFPEA